MTVTMESLPGGALATGAEASAAAASGAPVRLWPDTAIGWSSGRVTSSSSSSQAEWWRSRGSLAMARPNTVSTARGSAGSPAAGERGRALGEGLPGHRVVGPALGQQLLQGPCPHQGDGCKGELAPAPRLVDGQDVGVHVREHAGLSAQPPEKGVLGLELRVDHLDGELDPGAGGGAV